jgi:hypothetical protein
MTKLPRKPVFDRIHEIGDALGVIGETREFDWITKKLNADGFLAGNGEPYAGGGQGVPHAISAAYEYIEKTKSTAEAQKIARAFTDRNGNYPYEDK